MITSSGVLLGKDSVFSLEAEGQTLEYRVDSVGFKPNDDSKWLKAVGLEAEAAFRVFQERDLETVNLFSNSNTLAN